MHLQFRNLAVLLIVGAVLSATSTAWAATIWNVDASQSYLQLNIPDQPWFRNGTMYIRNQQATGSSIPWNQGNLAAIAGTISTDFENGTSIRFRDGEHDLAAVNSGTYIPDTPGGGGASAPGVFAGILHSSQVGFSPIYGRWFNFVIRDVDYGLASDVIPLAANTFSMDATSFAMTDSPISAVGAGQLALFPTSTIIHETTNAVGFNVGGTNAADLATITVVGNVLTLTMPINVPLSWDLNSTEYPLSLNATGTATGVIVATTIVPEPTTIATAAIGGIALLCCAWRTRRRNR